MNLAKKNVHTSTSYILLICSIYTSLRSRSSSCTVIGLHSCKSFIIIIIIIIKNQSPVSLLSHVSPNSASTSPNVIGILVAHLEVVSNAAQILFQRSVVEVTHQRQDAVVSLAILATFHWRRVAGNHLLEEQIAFFLDTTKTVDKSPQ